MVVQELQRDSDGLRSQSGRVVRGTDQARKRHLINDAQNIPAAGGLDQWSTKRLKQETPVAAAHWRELTSFCCSHDREIR
jgi:hypothetical protein